VFSHVFQEYIQGTLFFEVEWVNLAVVARESVRFKVDGVIPLATRGKSLGGFFLEDGSLFVVNW
jgi:hypothetical protein